MKPEAPVTQTVFPAIPVFSSLLRTPSSPLLFSPTRKKNGFKPKGEENADNQPNQSAIVDIILSTEIILTDVSIRVKEFY
jgi:hypothetical protein